MLYDLYQQEKKSLLALKLFVARAGEILNLWKVLYDHQFHLLAATLSPVCTFFKNLLTFRSNATNCCATFFFLFFACVTG